MPSIFLYSFTQLYNDAKMLSVEFLNIFQDFVVIKLTLCDIVHSLILQNLERKNFDIIVFQLFHTMWSFADQHLKGILVFCLYLYEPRKCK